MFGLSLVRTRKIKALYEYSASIVVENQELTLKLESVAELANWAQKRHDYIRATNRTPARKGEEYQKILLSLIKSLGRVS